MLSNHHLLVQLFKVHLHQLVQLVFQVLQLMVLIVHFVVHQFQIVQLAQPIIAILDIFVQLVQLDMY